MRITGPQETHEFLFAALAQSLFGFGQETTAPVERVSLVVPVSHGLVLHPATALVELGVGELDHMKWTGHLDGARHHGGEDFGR